MAQDLSRLPDDELMRSLKALTCDERRHSVSILRHLAEMDRRRLALKEGYPSLFEYCRRELKYAEGEAARRIHAARASARFPILYRAIGRGALSLTTVLMLAPHLKWENHRRLIRSALGKTKRDVEKLIAAEAPAPEPAERIRFISVPSHAPAATPGAAAGTQAPSEWRPSVPTPLAEPPALGAARVRFSFTADQSLLESVDRAKALLRHRHPFGGLEEIFTESMAALLEKIDLGRRKPRQRRRKKIEPGQKQETAQSDAGAERTPGPSGDSLASRHIPASVKEQVWKRDGGKCAFVSEGGRRCGTGEELEIDHVLPWALGGASDDPENLRLLCRRHNDLQARFVFGDAAVDAAVSAARARSS